MSIEALEHHQIQTQHQAYCASALTVIDTEALAIEQLKQRIDHRFAHACDTLLQAKGRIIVVGIGKSGHIARKIAATLASTGSPAFFVHPAEACHGDFGMITREDAVLAISNSGTNSELVLLLPLLKRLSIPIIALTGELNSPLAQYADIVLDVSVSQEACPLGLAPTASTTAALVMGDALAMALLQARGFTTEDFAFSHPGGRLGRRLILRVADIMHTADELPIATEQNTIAEAILIMSAKTFGCTFIINNQHELSGIYTDGDLRRTLEREINIKITPIVDVMSKRCKTITSDTLAIDALNLMQQHKITALAVLDQKAKLTGLIHMHDLLKHGVV